MATTVTFNNLRGNYVPQIKERLRDRMIDAHIDPDGPDVEVHLDIQAHDGTNDLYPFTAVAQVVIHPAPETDAVDEFLEFVEPAPIIKQQPKEEHGGSRCSC